MLLIFQVIVVLFLNHANLVTTTPGRKLQAYQNKNLRNRMIKDKPMFATYERSKIECCKRCIDKEGCLAFFYSTVTQECRMYDRDVSGKTKTYKENGWSYYYAFKVCTNDTSYCPVENKGYRYNDLMCFCYKYFSTPRIYVDADLDCRSDRGLLVKIDRDLKQNEIVTYLDSLGLPEKQYVWIQGWWNNSAWLYNDSSPIRFSRWKTIDNGQNEDRKIAISVYGNYYWYRKDENTKLPYLCEIPEKNKMFN